MSLEAVSPSLFYKDRIKDTERLWQSSGDHIDLGASLPSVDTNPSTKEENVLKTNLQGLPPHERIQRSLGSQASVVISFPGHAFGLWERHTYVPGTVLARAILNTREWSR